ncbi:hypothetical protein SAMN05444162_5001 [Paenibacillaceae bacterium GAS479]|nr:hypothetical protein SAMN05444162_5001 [Paenibacillaceae bacterium GAS479]
MKKNLSKPAILIGTSFLIFVLPLIGSIVRWGELPPGYGSFPAQKTVEPPGFSLGFFIFACAVALLITLFLLVPRWFGFRNGAERAVDEGGSDVTASGSGSTVTVGDMHQSATDVSNLSAASAEHGVANRTAAAPSGYPVWFWWSLPVLVISWLLMWVRIPALPLLNAFSFVPLWWSFILLLDGVVYKRSGGNSILAKKPHLMQILAIVSCFSWFVFEYLNFFVLANWYYPNNTILSDFGNVFWFSLSYTTVLPAIFEWYTLLLTFPALRKRYSNGPKLKVSRQMLLLFYGAGVILAFGMGYFPSQLFWVLWVALVPLLSAAMGIAGLWTPFTPLRNGNWSPILLIAIATLLNGLFWELWNFGSGYFNSETITNPNFWKYSVPYLDKIHLFSEMPILGYFGYLFFGVNCWIMWLAAAYICKFDPEIVPGASGSWGKR